MTATYTIKGINDDTDACSCCGRIGLKRVVWLAMMEGGEEVGEPAPFGTTCAAQKLGLKAAKRAAQERAIEEALSTAVNAKIRAILSSFIPSGNMLFPKECLDMPVGEMIAYRNQRWPILRFRDGQMTLADAARWL